MTSSSTAEVIIAILELLFFIIFFKWIFNFQESGLKTVKVYIHHTEFNAV